MNKEYVAIKILDKTKLDAKTQRLLAREIGIMDELHHPNIIRLYEVIEDQQRINIIMEYASGGELYSMLMKNGPLKETVAKIIFSQIVAAIDHLHNKNIVHRDIKAENVFFSGRRSTGHPLINKNADLFSHSPKDLKLVGLTHSEVNLSSNAESDAASAQGSSLDDYLRDSRLLHVKLGDFGFSKSAKFDDKLTTFCGSPPYAAPELFNKDWYFGTFVDMWALGILLFFILTAALPFLGDNVSQMKRAILSGQYTIPAWISREARSIISGLLQMAPADRLTITKLLQHSWLKKSVFPSVHAVLNESFVEAFRTNQGESVARERPVILE